MLTRMSLGAAFCGCVLLLFLDIWGLVAPPDFRESFAQPLLSYNEALSQIDQASGSYGSTRRFLKTAARVYADAIAYQWPAGMARVSFTDNWILAFAAYLDPLIERVGLKNNSDLFSQFESFRYERALGRGFGICSENALGFADLLNRRYGIDAHVVGLGGHVVVLARLEHSSRMLLDPSVGVSFPFGLRHAEQIPAKLWLTYEKAGQTDIPATYDHADNFVSPSPGAWGYSASQYWKQNVVRYFERAADLLKWAIPVVGCFLCLGIYLKQRSFQLAISRLHAVHPRLLS